MTDFLALQIALQQRYSVTSVGSTSFYYWWGTNAMVEERMGRPILHFG